MVNFDALHKADPQRLAKFIHNGIRRRSRSCFPISQPTQAAALLVSLPPELRSDIALRMARPGANLTEIIGKIATVIDQKLKTLGEFSRESYGGVRVFRKSSSSIQFE